MVIVLRRSTLLRWQFSLFVCSLVTHAYTNDVPCNAKAIGSSVICVCNSTYCDTITREPLEIGTFVAYTSNKAGLRFQKQFGQLSEPSSVAVKETSTVLTLNPSIKYQYIYGFGGAVTDSASINWKSLSEGSRRNFVRSYFADDGLEYTFIRVPIGSSDYSPYNYTYNEYPMNDVRLTNFSLGPEDIDYKIPLIKSCMAESPSEVKVLGSNWSPPRWMHTGEYGEISYLKDEYFQTFADYHLRFVEKYDEQGVRLWGLTTTNEPVMCSYGIVLLNSIGWRPEKQAIWVTENLGPTIRNSKYSNVKLLGVDDQRHFLPIWLDTMNSTNPSSIDYLDGIAVHFYYDLLIPPQYLSKTSSSYPDKFILSTEASAGVLSWQIEPVLLGSWERAELYLQSLLQDLNNKVAGWIDWNMALDPNSGPKASKPVVDAPVIVFAETDEFVKQPMFYALGHVSKFIPPGSRAIDIQYKNSVRNLLYAAVITPQNTVVVILYNGNTEPLEVTMNIPGSSLQVEVGAKTLKTIELKGYPNLS